MSAVIPSPSSTSASSPVIPAPCPSPAIWVDDVHSRLNLTRVSGVLQPKSLAELQEIVRSAASANRPISICGGRHAMGGQQFGTDTLLVDMRRLCRILSIDDSQGIVDVEAGIEWPELVSQLRDLQSVASSRWSIRQKQTGADHLTIGGAVAANIHGRGLTMRPFVNDIESLTLIGPDGTVRDCSRTENPELFGLVVGGYGLFGIVYSIRLRLARLHKVERIVERIPIEGLMDRFDEHIAAGFEFGDFQYSTDEGTETFMREGIFSCYRPVDAAAVIAENQRSLNEEDWRGLILLGHTAKGEAYRRYADYYLSTSGQVYWSDEHQLSTYVDDYHGLIDRIVDAPYRCSEMITEIFVPRDRLVAFLAAARADFLQRGVNLIYGTIRLIESERETLLCWARRPWACVIFNLHVEHTAAGLVAGCDAFRGLIDRAIELDGSFYLTYHRYATAEQLLACYPRLPEFLELKKRYDPATCFTSDWYRHVADTIDP